MPNIRRASGRRALGGRVGTPAQLLGSRLQQRVQPTATELAVRNVYGLTRYADRLQSGTPREMLGKYGITLNGSTEWAETGTLPIWTGADSLTISVWVNASAADGFVCGHWNASSTYTALVQVASNGRMRVFVSMDGTASNYRVLEHSEVVTGTGWRHVVLRYQAGVLEGFLDNTAFDDSYSLTVGTGTTINQTPSTFVIGADTGGAGAEEFQGSVDDIRVWSGAISDAEIAAIAAMKPGSQSGATTATPPLIHYKCEDSVTSTILRNSGTLGSVSDATITTAAIATVRGTTSPVYSFANSVGGTQSYTTDGVDDYLDTQLTLDGATAFTVWRRARYLSNFAYDLDGFINSGGSTVRIGRNTGNYTLAFDYGDANLQTPGQALPINKTGTLTLTSTVGGNYSARIDGVEVDTGTATGFTAISNTYPYRIGVNNGATPANFSHVEYHEYLIADRVLTADEELWLNTGGQAGTAIDIEGDANILLYTDFSDQTATTIRNHADENLPILKSAGGELTMVPRSESDTTKDVDQAEYAYRSAVYLDSSVNSGKYLDFGSALIPATADFDISVDFLLMAETSVDGQSAILSQYDVGGSGRFLFEYVDASNTVRLFINGGTPISVQAANNAVTLGKWHTMRATRVGDTFTVWLDGVQIGTQTQAGISVYQAANTMLGCNDSVNDDFKGLVSNIDFGSGQQYLTRPGETITGATLSNASYVDFVRGKPGTIQHTGIAPRDMVLTEPALVLNGTGTEHVTLPVGIRSSSTWEMSCWVKTTDADGTIYRDAEGTTDGWDIALAAGEFRVKSDGATLDTVRTFNDGVWHHFRAVWDGATTYMYVDGTLEQSGAMSAPASLTSPLSRIGAGWSANLAGTFADFKLTVDGTQVVHYSFAGNTGDFEPDLSGNGNDGTLAGTVATMRAGTIAGKGSGTCVADGYAVATYFDGAADSLNLTGRLTSGTITELSCAAWLRPELIVASGTICSEFLFTGNQRSWNWRLNTARQMELVSSSDGTGGTIRGTSPVIGDWDVLVHVGFSFAGDTIKWYVNGVLVETDTITATTFYDSSSDFTIGNTLTTQFFEGLISQLAIEQAVWTDEEFAAIKETANINSVRANATVFASGGFGDSRLTVVGAPEQRVLPPMPPVNVPFAYGTRYDGTTDYFNKGSRLSSGTLTALSAGVWVRREANSTMAMLSEYRFSDNNRAWQWYLHTDGTQRVHLSSDGNTGGVTNATSGAIDLGELAHVAFTYDGTTVTFYVNGIATTSTQGSGSIPASLFNSTSEFNIASFNNGGGSFVDGLLAQAVVHAGVTWSPANVAAVMAAGTAAQIQAALSGLGGTAWFFERGDGVESIQDIDPMTKVGNPKQAILADASIPKTQAAGTIPPGLPAPSHGPGLLPPDHSLDVYANEDDSPFSQAIAGDLADGNYDFGDGDEADALYRRGDANGEEIAVINPAATGAEQTILENWST